MPFRRVTSQYLTSETGAQPMSEFLPILLQVIRQLQELSQYDHIAFTSTNGIHAVMDLLARLHGSQGAALQALQDSKAQCWALGADADALRQLGLSHVQTPTEVCPPSESFSLIPTIATVCLSASSVCKQFASSAISAACPCCHNQIIRCYHACLPDELTDTTSSAAFHPLKITLWKQY